MKIRSLLSLLSLVLLVAATNSRQKKSPKVIRLDEIKIVGDIERPTVNFVIARASFDFLDGNEFLEKKNLIFEITDAVKNDIFEVR